MGIFYTLNFFLPKKDKEENTYFLRGHNPWSYQLFYENNRLCCSIWEKSAKKFLVHVIFFFENCLQLIYYLSNKNLKTFWSKIKKKSYFSIISLSIQKSFWGINSNFNPPNGNYLYPLFSPIQGLKREKTHILRGHKSWKGVGRVFSPYGIPHT